MAATSQAWAMPELEPNLFIILPSILLFFATIAVSLRMYVRTIMTKAFGFDDCFLLLAYGTFASYSILLIITGSIEKMPHLHKHLPVITELSLAATLSYIVSQCTVKWAIAGFLHRITIEKWQRIIIWTSVTIYTLYTIAYGFVTLFQCGVPTMSHLINPSSCLDWSTVMEPLSYTGACTNAIVDLIFTFIPIPLVFKRTMPWSVKIPVICLILFGMLGSSIAVARIPLLMEIKYTHSLLYFREIIPESALSVTESAIAIITISVVTLRPLFTNTFKYRGKLHSGEQSMSMLYEPEGKLARNVKMPFDEFRSVSEQA